MIKTYVAGLATKVKLGRGIWLTLLTVVFLASIFRSYSRVKKAETKITEAQGRVENLKQENNELEKRIEEMATNEFIEKQLRDKLGLVKEGEIVVVLPEPEVLRKLAPQRETEPETLPDPNWKKWMKLFL